MIRDKSLRIRLASSKEAQELDRRAQKDGISGLGLMNEAGGATFRFIESKVLPFLPLESILILVGPGNNGGDALVVAKELAAKGFSNISLWTFSEDVSELQQKQWDNLDQFDFDISRFEATSEQKELLNKSSLIIDGLFGVGLDRVIEGSYRTAIEWVNEALEPVLSLDVPSGLNADTGRTMGACIEAQWTTTYGVAKPGFYIWDGPSVVGECFTFDIGFPKTLVEEICDDNFLVDLKVASSLLPVRRDTSNKTKHGRTKVFAGQEGTWGAAL